MRTPRETPAASSFRARAALRIRRDTLRPVPTIADQAIVLRTWDFSETSQTAALFTRAHGVIRGLAKGAKREKGAFSGGFEPVSHGQVVAIVKPTTELATLTEWDLQEIFPAIRRSLRAHYAALYYVDLVSHAVTDADPHPALWDALLRALRALDESVDPLPVTLAQQWATLREAGYQPRLEVAKGDAPLTFDPGAGEIIRSDAPGGDASWGVRPQTVALLRALEGLDDPVALIERARAAELDTLDRANRLLASYLRWVLDATPKTMTLLFPIPSRADRRTR